MRVLRAVFVLLLVAVMLGAGLVGLAVWHFGRGLPDYQQLADYQPPIVTRIYAGDGRLLGEYASEKRVFVPVSAMPPKVLRAFIAAEDKDFYNHPGVNPLAILRAGITDLAYLGSQRRPIGASTITQQVAKNFLLTNEVSIERKAKEILLALRLEQALSKERILELYLNEIYLGGGSYGVAAAALHYFNKPLDELTVAEAAYIAALPKAPNNYNPQRFPAAAKARRDWVVQRMQEDGYITAAQAAEAEASPIETRQRDAADLASAPWFAEEVRRELLARYGDKGLYQSGLAVRTSLDPHLQAIADKVLRDGIMAYDRRHGWRGPVAHVDLQTDWQAQIKGAAVPPGAAPWRLALVLATDEGGARIGLADGKEGRLPLDEMRWARPSLPDQHLGPVPKTTTDVVKPGDFVLVEPVEDAAPAKPGVAPPPPRFALRQLPQLSGGLVAMDPHTGRVLAIDGGFSYETSQFNRAIQAKRQPGSSFKPYVYMTALENGFTPSTLVLDAPFVIDQGPGLPLWKPSNYEGAKFSGPTTLRVGLEESKNMLTARLGQTVGLEKVAEVVQRFGIIDHMPLEYSMLLGAGETTLLRQATGYSMIVNGGKRVTPTFIDRIQDRDGKTVFRADNRPCADCQNVEWTGQAPPDLPDQRERVIDAGTAYQMVSMLQGVVERGTGTLVRAVGKPLAGKTGTTNDFQDNWFVGFSPDLTVAVYLGFDQPRTLGRGEVGGRNAAPIFRDFMTSALEDKPGIPFRIPPGIRLVRVNPATGRPARASEKNAIYEAFKPGTEPSGESVVIGGVGAVDEETPDGTGPAAPIRAVPASGTGGLY
jgi:penicillin-binding protein 1A